MVASRSLDVEFQNNHLVNQRTVIMVMLKCPNNNQPWRTMVPELAQCSWLAG
jgi:hypothetical protein